ncbi:MAG: DUF6428 family protein [Pseudorhodoplanes sp.]|uniref:DUF6428 family protein n=1 Tax=Pseudorhodoplanes sp. TaxID=1934341 RepID=UPI003D13544D
MTALARAIPLTPPPADEISTAGLLAELAPHGARRLVFSYEGRDILPGYHVTEVKDGRFAALDCGSNPEAWRETFIQLWDVPGEADRDSHMRVAKFIAIIRKVGELVTFDETAKLTFEVSDGRGAIKLYRAEDIAVVDDAVRVSLSQRPASCKPRDRWLEEGSPKAKRQPCCG